MLCKWIEGLLISSKAYTESRDFDNTIQGQIVHITQIGWQSFIRKWRRLRPSKEQRQGAIRAPDLYQTLPISARLNTADTTPPLTMGQGVFWRHIFGWNGSSGQEKALEKAELWFGKPVIGHLACCTSAQLCKWLKLLQLYKWLKLLLLASMQGRLLVVW